MDLSDVCRRADAAWIRDEPATPPEEARCETVKFRCCLCSIPRVSAGIVPACPSMASLPIKVAGLLSLDIDRSALQQGETRSANGINMVIKALFKRSIRSALPQTQERAHKASVTNLPVLRGHVRSTAFRKLEALGHSIRPAYVVMCMDSTFI